MITPDQVLVAITGLAARDGHLVPAVDSPQARAAAERLLRILGLTPAEPPRQLPPSPVDSPTQALPVVAGEQPLRHRIRGSGHVRWSA